jgi:hypothetical protein
MLNLKKEPLYPEDNRVKPGKQLITTDKADCKIANKPLSISWIHPLKGFLQIILYLKLIIKLIAEVALKELT